MPQFDLRGIKVAKYNNTAGTVSYSEAQSVGDAMNVSLELRYAEGRLYAESTLAEYMRKATGGTISIGVKYIPEDAKQLMFGSTEKTRSVTVSSQSKQITSLVSAANDVPSAVGVSFYAPDMVDGVEKYTCVFISRALFGAPSMALQTMGESITFNTPTTTGEFMPDHSTGRQMMETAIVDTIAEAVAWCNAVISAT